MTGHESASEEGWSGFEGLDKLLEHRVRLATCVLLSRDRRLTFRRLKDLLEETDGSLGTHLGKLEKAGYVTVKREFQGGRPTSWYSLRRAGRSALERHVRGLEVILGHRKPPGGGSRRQNG